MNPTDTFGTAINCIDGRVQTPVDDWIKLHAGVQYVDMITEPGADKVLATSQADKVAAIFEKLKISIEAHQSRIVGIAGHFDCAANPVDFEVHKDQILEAYRLLESWNLGVRVVGLYVNEWSAVDVICDTETEYEQIRSFL